MRTTEQKMLEMIQGQTVVLNNILKIVDVLSRKVMDLEARPKQWRQPEPGKPRLVLVPKPKRGDD